MARLIRSEPGLASPAEQLNNQAVLLLSLPFTLNEIRYTVNTISVDRVILYVPGPA